MKNKIIFFKKLVLAIFLGFSSISSASVCNQVLDIPVHKIELTVQRKGERIRVEIFDSLRESKKPIIEAEFVRDKEDVKVLFAWQDFIVKRISNDELPKSELTNFGQMGVLAENLAKDLSFTQAFGFPMRINVTNAHRSFLVDAVQQNAPNRISRVVLDKVSSRPKRVFIYEDIDEVDDDDEKDEDRRSLQGLLNLSFLIKDYASSFEEPIAPTEAQIKQFNLENQKRLDLE